MGYMYVYTQISGLYIDKRDFFGEYWEQKTKQKTRGRAEKEKESDGDRRLESRTASERATDGERCAGNVCVRIGSQLACVFVTRRAAQPSHRLPLT